MMSAVSSPSYSWKKSYIRAKHILDLLNIWICALLGWLMRIGDIHIAIRCDCFAIWPRSARFHSRGVLWVHRRLRRAVQLIVSDVVCNVSVRRIHVVQLFASCAQLMWREISSCWPRLKDRPPYARYMGVDIGGWLAHSARRDSLVAVVQGEQALILTVLMKQQAVEEQDMLRFRRTILCNW